MYRQCKKCGKLLPPSAYYSYSYAFFTKCKTCHKQRALKRYNENTRNPVFMAKEKNRQSKKNAALYHNSKLVRLKLAAGNAARKYKIKGLKSVELHHWSYNEKDWLDVIYMTRKDHRLIHRFLTYDMASQYFISIGGRLLDTRRKHINFIIKILNNYGTNKEVFWRNAIVKRRRGGWSVI